MLSKLFSEFDKKVLENNIFKLYTIGDCYVILGFIDIEKRSKYKYIINQFNRSFNWSFKCYQNRVINDWNY